MRDNNDFNKYPLYPGESVDTNMDHRVGVNDTIIDTIPYNGSYIMTTDPVAESDEPGPGPGPEPVPQPNDEVWYTTYSGTVPEYHNLGFECKGKYGEYGEELSIEDAYGQFEPEYGRAKWISQKMSEDMNYNEKWSDQSSYTADTIVYDNDRIFWKCIVDAPEGTPLQEGEYWEKYSDWDDQYDYYMSSPSMVYYKGVLWVCIQDNSGEIPEDGSEYWEKYAAVIKNAYSSYEGIDDDVKSIQFSESTTTIGGGGDTHHVEFCEFCYSGSDPIKFDPSDMLQYGEDLYFLKFNNSSGIHKDEWSQYPINVDEFATGKELLISVPERSEDVWAECFTGTNVRITSDNKYRNCNYQSYLSRDEIFIIDDPTIPQPSEIWYTTKSGSLDIANLDLVAYNKYNEQLSISLEDCYYDNEQGHGVIVMKNESGEHGSDIVYIGEINNDGDNIKSITFPHTCIGLGADKQGGVIGTGHIGDDCEYAEFTCTNRAIYILKKGILEENPKLYLVKMRAPRAYENESGLTNWRQMVYSVPEDRFEEYRNSWNEISETIVCRYNDCYLTNYPAKNTMIEYIPDNEIWYTSYTNQVVNVTTEAYDTSNNPISITGNTYDTNLNRGVITFSGSVKQILSMSGQDGIKSIQLPITCTLIQNIDFSSVEYIGLCPKYGAWATSRPSFSVYTFPDNGINPYFVGYGLPPYWAGNPTNHRLLVPVPREIDKSTYEQYYANVIGAEVVVSLPYFNCTYQNYPAREDIPWDELIQNNGE